MATSSTPAASARSRPGEIRHQRRVAYARAPVDAANDLGRVGHLRHPARADERRHLDRREAGGGQPVDERDLVGGGDRRVLVLQAVARPDLDDPDVGSRRGSAGAAHAISRRPTPGCTSSPTRQATVATVPSRGARTASSIFIASSFTSTSPLATRLAGFDEDSP